MDELYAAIIEAQRRGWPSHRIDQMVRGETKNEYQNHGQFLMDYTQQGEQSIAQAGAPGNRVPETQAILLEDARRAVDFIGQKRDAGGLPVAGSPLAQLASVHGSSDAGRLDALITTIRNNAFFKGAAAAAEQGISLTPLSDSDRDALASVYGQLSVGMHPDDLTRNLRRLHNIVARNFGAELMPESAGRAAPEAPAPQQQPQQQGGLFGNVLGYLGDEIKEGISGAFPTVIPNANQLRYPSPMPQSAAHAAVLAAWGAAPAAIRAIANRPVRSAVAGLGVASPALEYLEQRTGLPINVVKHVVQSMGLIPGVE